MGLLAPDQALFLRTKSQIVTSRRIDVPRGMTPPPRAFGRIGRGTFGESLTSDGPIGILR